MLSARPKFQRPRGLTAPCLGNAGTPCPGHLSSTSEALRQSSWLVSLPLFGPFFREPEGKTSVCVAGGGGPYSLCSCKGSMTIFTGGSTAARVALRRSRKVRRFPRTTHPFANGHLPAQKQTHTPDQMLAHTHAQLIAMAHMHKLAC